MNAKQKLNVANINGAVVIAALMGWLTGSWFVFVLVLIVLLCGAVSAGNIR